MSLLSPLLGLAPLLVLSIPVITVIGSSHLYRDSIREFGAALLVSYLVILLHSVSYSMHGFPGDTTPMLPQVFFYILPIIGLLAPPVHSYHFRQDRRKAALLLTTYTPALLLGLFSTFLYLSVALAALPF